MARSPSRLLHAASRGLRDRFQSLSSGIRRFDLSLVVIVMAFLWAVPFQAMPALDWNILRPGWLFAQSSSPPERFLDAVRDRPPLLRAFLQQFPKGGNLHIHLSGAIYLERLIDFGWARDGLKGLCVAGTPVRIATCDPDAKPDKMVPLASLLTGAVRPGDPMPAELQGSFPFQRMIDAMTLRNFEPGDTSSPDQFFGAFGAIGPLLNAEATRLAIADLQAPRNAQGLQYFEVMMSLQDIAVTPPAPGETAANRPPDQTWFRDLVQAALADRGIPDVWPAGTELSADQIKTLDTALGDIVHARAVAVAQHLDDAGLGGCSPDACRTDLRFIQQLNRTTSPGQFYAQLVFARELLGAEQSRPVHRVVGLNMVSPEHDPVSRIAVTAQMAMLRAVCGPTGSPCHGRIALHAGELVVGLLPPADLQDHITLAIDAGARRIGHGVMIGAEATPPGGPPFALFEKLAADRIAIEINLSSNKTILGVTGRDHPLRDYLAFRVPVVLGTDDEGVARSDVTNEWMQAVLDNGLGYADLVRMARDSLEYSFMDGASLWDANAPAGVHRRADACRGDRLDAAETALGASCQRLLHDSDRARQEWRLEQALAKFAAQDWDAVLHRMHGGA